MTGWSAVGHPLYPVPAERPPGGEAHRHHAQIDANLYPATGDDGTTGLVGGQQHQEERPPDRDVRLWRRAVQRDRRRTRGARRHPADAACPRHRPRRADRAAARRLARVDAGHALQPRQRPRDAARRPLGGHAADHRGRCDRARARDRRGPSRTSRRSTTSVSIRAARSPGAYLHVARTIAPDAGRAAADLVARSRTDIG